MSSTAAIADTEHKSITPRQQQVLAAALDVLVAEGDRLTMTAVARRASCSKETLYKWFGDRGGLLTATVQWQAAKVRVPQLDPRGLDAVSLRAGLEQFARDLLGTIAGEVSVALNRLAISHAGASATGLGGIMLAHGPAAIRRRVRPLLKAGHDAGLIAAPDTEEAYRTFFGLTVRDTQIRLLLGEQLTLGEAEIAAAATAATDQFFRLHGATNSNAA